MAAGDAARGDTEMAEADEGGEAAARAAAGRGEGTVNEGEMIVSADTHET